jgi:hypothetical protein
MMETFSAVIFVAIAGAILPVVCPEKNTYILFLFAMGVCCGAMFVVYRELKRVLIDITQLNVVVDTVATKMEELESERPNTDLALRKIESALDSVERLCGADIVNNNRLHELWEHVDRVQVYLERCLDGQAAIQHRINSYMYRNLRHGIEESFELEDMQSKFRELDDAFGL